MMAVAVMALALPFTAGCMKLDQALTLRPDGSGVVELKYSMSEETIVQFRAMLDLRDKLMAVQGAQENDSEQSRLHEVFLNASEEQVRNELRKYEKVGVKIDTLKVQSVDGWRQTHMVLLFDSLATLAETEVFKDYGFNLTKNKDGDYLLSRPPESSMAGADADNSLLDPDGLKMVTPILAGFHAGFRITVPGRVLSSTAHRKGTQNAVWNFDFDTDPNALVALQNQAFEVTFDGKDAKLPQVKLRSSKRAAAGQARPGSSK